MTSCCIEPYLRRTLPGHVASVATGLFDLIPVVTRLNPSSLDGIDLNEDWVFGPRVNIVAGPSGSGKTRILEALKHPVSISLNLMPPVPTDFTGKSMGQTLVLLTEIMLQVQPPGTCLLLDDVFCCFDQGNMEHASDFLKAHPKQVVLTIPSHAERYVKTLCERASARCFHLPLIPPMQAAGGHTHAS